MKSDKKTSVRLPSKKLEQIDGICKDNGNCSRAKVIKCALDFVINGKSEIKFDQKNTEQKNKPEVALQSFIPGFRCTETGCIQIHPNPNYKNRVTAYCSRCGQFAKNNIGPCPWCRYLNTLQLVNENWLDQIGIPKPL